MYQICTNWLGNVISVTVPDNDVPLAWEFIKREKKRILQECFDNPAKFLNDN